MGVRSIRAGSAGVAAVLAVACALAFVTQSPGALNRSSSLAGAATPSLAIAAPARHLMESIVRAWSARLNARDNAGIARLFALPATIVQAPYAYRLVTRHQVALWYSELPCSGHITSITYRGRFATAVFRLGNRGATRCDDPGALAAARFEIVDGKIASWEQVPVPTKKRPTGPVA